MDPSSHVPVRVTKWRGDAPPQSVEDAVACEEPLEIRVGSHPLSVTMRTPGHDEELAAGFLLTERVVRRAADIARIDAGAPHAPANVVNVTLAAGLTLDTQRLTRHVFASSSCGLCGKATLDAVRCELPGVTSGVAITAEELARLPQRLRGAQATFDVTGGLHAAALCSAAGELLVVREDVGRHNAVDKALGHALLAGRVPLDEHLLLVSGRSSFEIVQKALAAGVAIVAAVSAPSSLAVELAAASGITLVGFLRDGRMNVYTHPQRVEG